MARKPRRRLVLLDNGDPDRAFAHASTCIRAARTAGNVDLVAIGLACCYMISACDRVRDYDRAVQWCTRLKAFSAKWGLRPLFAVCRTQYASICMWRGTWLEAEQELTAATEELSVSVLQ